MKPPTAGRLGQDMAQFTEDGKSKMSGRLGQTANSLLANTLATIDQTTRTEVQFANLNVVPLIPYVNLGGKCQVEDIHTRDRVNFPENTFCMIDPASTASYVSEKLIAKIPHHVFCRDVHLKVKSLSGKTTTYTRSKLVGFQMRFSKRESMFVVAATIPHVSDLPEFCSHMKEDLHRVSANRPVNHVGNWPSHHSSDILLGQPSCWKMHDQVPTDVKGQPDLQILRTPVGEIWSGGFRPSCKCRTKERECNFTQAQDLAQTIRRLWAAEQLSHDFQSEHMTMAELRCYKHFEQNVIYDAAKAQYTVGLPWINGSPPKMTNTYPIALARFRAFERQCAKYDKDTNERVIESVEEHIRSGRYSEIEERDYGHYMDPAADDLYIMPCRLVLDETKETTKARFCFDASQKMKGLGHSLNDLVYKGPRLTPNTDELLLQYRKHRYSISLDLRQMFLCIAMKESDRPYQTFLWRKPNSGEKMKIYRANVVVFGNTASPFLAAMTVKHHATKCLAESNDPEIQEAARVTLKYLYCDDLILSINTEDEAVTLVRGLEKMFSCGGFFAAKYKSNSKKVLDYLRSVDPDKISKSHQDLLQPGAPFEEKNGVSASVYCPGQSKKDDVLKAKVLGQAYDVMSDLFVYSNYEHLKTELMSRDRHTKRILASAMAHVSYCLTGRIAPFVLQARVLLQEVFKRDVARGIQATKQSWDTLLDDDLQEKFTHWYSQLKELGNITLPRALDLQPDHELVGFCDASNVGYSAVIYSRDIDPENGQVRISYVGGRCKVRPLSMASETDETETEISIPRLELLSLQMLEQLMAKTRAVFQTPKEKCTLYTDSSISYFWSRTPLESLTPWVYNRIEKAVNEQYDIRYLPSEVNAAADRGAKTADVAEILNDSPWATGPAFIRLPPKDRPVFDPLKVSKMDRAFNHGVKKARLVECHATTNLVMTTTDITVMEKIAASSGTFKAFMNKVAALMFAKHMWKNFWRQKKRKYNTRAGRQLDDTQKKQTLSDFLPAARMAIFAYHQKKKFPDEYAALENGEEISKQSKLISFNPYLDTVHGIPVIRSNGRIGKARSSAFFKQPVLLPKPEENDHADITWLFMEHEHRKMWHLSYEALHFNLRQCVWILHGKESCRKLIKTCVRCNKANAHSMAEAKMGSLPEERVNLDQWAPGAALNLDSVGPFRLRSSCETEGKKCGLKSCHILVLVDSISRYVSLYVVPDLSSHSLMSALIQHFGIFGRPRKIISDGFAALKRIKNELSALASSGADLRKELTTDQMKQFSTDFEFTWEITPPYSSHRNGAVESLNRVLKNALFKTLKSQDHNFYDFFSSVRFCQYAINSRPLFPLAADEGHDMTVSPNQLMFGHQVAPLELNGFSELVMDKWKGIWRSRQILRDRFLRLFETSYLSALMGRPKWRVSGDQIEPGMIFLYCGPEGSGKVGKSPKLWQTCRVIRKIDSKNNAATYEVRLANPEYDQVWNPEKRVYELQDPDQKQKKAARTVITAAQYLIKLEGLSNLSLEEMKTYLPAGETKPTQTQAVGKAQAHTTYHLSKRAIDKGFRRFKRYRNLSNQWMQADIFAQ